MTTDILPIIFPKLFKNQPSKQPISTEINELKLSRLQKYLKFRENCIRFIIGLCGKYKFKKDTLFLAVHILDQLISDDKKSLLQDQQILAGCLVLLTTKFNEVYPVTINQINKVTHKSYSRSTFFRVQGQILESINFQMPSSTLFSKLYNHFEPKFQKIIASDSDKQNDRNSESVDTDCSQKEYVKDKQDLVSKTMKALKQPECFKYGQEILFLAFVGYIQKQKLIGSSAEIFKINYIKTVLRNIFDPEKHELQRKSRENYVPKTEILKQKHQISYGRIKKSSFFIF